MNRAAQGEAGFTLVEVLVSLALLALLVVYGLQAFSAMGNMRRAADDLAGQAEVSAAASHLREAIAGARPVFMLDGSGQPVLRFSGEADRLEFVTASSGDRETGGLLSVAYRLDGNRLVSERRVLRDQDPSAPIAATLMSGIESLSFHYLAGEVPSDSWTRTDALPSAIEVDMKFAEGTARNWAPLVVRLNAAQ